MTCNDLNLKSSFFPFSRGAGHSYVFRQTRFFANYGLRSVATVSNLYRPISRRLENPYLQVLRVLSRHGFRATHLPRKPARHHLVLKCNATEALPHGDSVDHFAEQSLQCQQRSRLANLRRLRIHPNRPREEALRRPAARHRSRRNRLRTRFNHDRFMFNDVPLGDVSIDQVGRQSSYAHESSRKHPRIYPCFYRQNARCSYPRSSRVSTWRILCYGSSLPRLRTSVRNSSIAIILRHSCQTKHAIRSTLLQRGRPKHVGTMRSNRNARRILFVEVISGTAPSRSLLRRREQPTFVFSDQQHAIARSNDRGALQVSLADRIIFQMDQTAPANQEVFRHERERREIANLDRDQCLPARSNPEKGTWHQTHTLRNPTGFEPDPIRENPFKSSV